MEGHAMAANAFILVNVDPASTQGVIKKLEAIHGAMVHEVLRPYDLLWIWRRMPRRTSQRSCGTRFAPLKV